MSDLTPPPEGGGPGPVPGPPTSPPPPPAPPLYGAPPPSPPPYPTQRPVPAPPYGQPPYAQPPYAQPTYPPGVYPAAQFPTPQTPSRMPPPPGSWPQGGYPPGNYPPPGAPYGYVAVPMDRFGRPLAAWWQRLLAIMLDFAILFVPRAIVTGIVIGSSSGGILTASWRVSVVLVGVLFAVIGVAYFALLNGGTRGQTVGQMALGIAVRDEASGGAVGTPRAALRIIVLDPNVAIGWIPVLGSIAAFYSLVAAISPLWDSRRQGFHDKVARTDVVKVR